MVCFVPKRFALVRTKETHIRSCENDSVNYFCFELFIFKFVFFIRRQEVNTEEEEVTGWVPLSIKISLDSGEIHVTKIDEVRTLVTTGIVKRLIYVYYIRLCLLSF